MACYSNGYKSWCVKIIYIVSVLIGLMSITGITIGLMQTGHVAVPGYSKES